MSLYLNPTSGFVYISTGAAQQGGITRVEILDVNDKVVTTLIEAAPSSGRDVSFSFDCSSLASGTYFVHAQNGAFSNSARLVVVK